MNKNNLIKIGHDVKIEDGCDVGHTPSRNITNFELFIGDGSLIRTGSIIYLGSSIGKRFETGHNVIIREQCSIGDDVKIWSNSVIDYDVKIGDDVKIHSLAYISQKTVIEDHCFLAPGVMIANEKYPTGIYTDEKISGVTIREGAKIGINVTLLPGIVIGRNSIIGAGSTVTKDVEDNAVYYGNPAKRSPSSHRSS